MQEELTVAVDLDDEPRIRRQPHLLEKIALRDVMNDRFRPAILDVVDRDRPRRHRSSYKIAVGEQLRFHLRFMCRSAGGLAPPKTLRVRH